MMKATKTSSTWLRRLARVSRLVRLKLIASFLVTTNVPKLRIGKWFSFWSTPV